jgi:hypothetical protein
LLEKVTDENYPIDMIAYKISRGKNHQLIEKDNRLD